MSRFGILFVGWVLLNTQPVFSQSDVRISDTPKPAETGVVLSGTEAVSGVLVGDLLKDPPVVTASDLNSESTTTLASEVLGSATQKGCGAEDGCGAGKGCTCRDKCDRWYLFPQRECGLNVHGWLNGGFIWNTDEPPSNFNGPYNAVDRDREGMGNQAYLVAEKGLGQCGFGFGGRVDVLYGEDYFLAQSLGIETHVDGSAHWNGERYGLAFPQAYASLGNENLNVQVGHFYSVVGYEGLMAPANFFYSKSYSYQFAGPFTHWGAQANWKPSDQLTIQLGGHNGWDAFDRVTDDVGVIGKVRYDLLSGAWTSFAFTAGKEFNNPGGIGIVDEYTNRARYSWLVGLPLNCKLDYVFHHWLGWQDDGSVTGDGNWYGVDQYLYYHLNDCWKLGGRFEWFRDEDGTRVGLNRASNPNIPPLPGNYYSASIGANWSPTENLRIRPEFRIDWVDGSSLPFDDGANDRQYMLGIDGILLF